MADKNILQSVYPHIGGQENISRTIPRKDILYVMLKDAGAVDLDAVRQTAGIKAAELERGRLALQLAGQEENTMAQDYQKMGEAILEAVGGKENVTSLTHCMTRLRFNLKDKSKAKDETITKISGVIQVIHAGGQVQIVIGPTVDKVYDAVCKIGGFARSGQVETGEKAVKEKLTPKKILNNILDAVSGCITPILPLFMVAGIFNTVIILFGPKGLGWLADGCDALRLLSIVADACFYFYPIFVAYSASKKFNTSPVLALLLSGVMIHPDMLDIVSAGEAFSVYGIPMKLVNYTKAVLPIIMIVWVMSYVERFLKKIIPDVLRIVAIPVLTIAIMLPIALCAIGPLFSVVIGAIANGIVWLSSAAGWLTTAIAGATWSLVIATGMHVPVLTALLPVFLELGYDPVIQNGAMVQAYSLLTMALAYGLRASTKEERELGWSTFGTYALGRVSEPIIYGILLRDKKALAWHLIGGFAGGLFIGLSGAKLHILAGVGSPVLNVVRYGPDMAKGAIGCLIGIGVTFALAMVFGFEGSEKKEIKLKKKN